MTQINETKIEAYIKYLEFPKLIKSFLVIFFPRAIS